MRGALGFLPLLAVGVSACGSAQAIPPTPHMRQVARQLCDLALEVSSFQRESQSLEATRYTLRWYTVKGEYRKDQARQETRHPGRFATTLTDVQDQVCDA